MRALIYVLIACLAAPAAAKPLSCKPAYCSASLSFAGGITNNAARDLLMEDGSWASTTLELRADAVPFGNKIYTSFSLLAALSDRLDKPGNNLGLLIPQINMGREFFGMRFSIAYAPVLLFRDEFRSDLARFHDLNLGIKKKWRDHPYLTDKFDLRIEYKARLGEPVRGSENRFTVEAEATEFFDIMGREFRVWGEFRAEAGIKNRARNGTDIIYRFQNQIDLTTQVTDHLRLTLLSLRRDDRLESPGTKRFGRWDLAAGLRLRYSW